jgi:hypothetical protein
VRRLLEVYLKVHEHSLKKGLLELAQHIYEESHHIKWDKAKAIQKEPNTIYIEEVQGICSYGLLGEYD